MADKPSTEDILSKIRQQSAAGASGSDEKSSSDAAAPPETSAAEEAQAPAKPVAKAAPKGTAGILSAIRSQGGGASSSDSAAEEAPAAKAKPAAAPKGTAGILASIRSQGKQGDAAAGGDTPQAAPKKKATAAAPAGDLPPVSEMLQQMKAGRKPGATATAAPAKPAKPQLKIPAKPAKKAAGDKETRRSFLYAMFLTPFGLAWTMMATISGVWLLAIARFMFPNVLVEPPSQFKIGPASDYPPESVSTKWAASRAIWIIHTTEYNGKDLLYALQTVCTHLGCTPSWLEGEQKFKCPCHGSGFYKNGINFEGPAPRPLERVGLQIAADGMLEVDKSVKFQEEKGQWEDPKSFVDASLA
ncbi:MAG: QcrA and Rieske domain-containing protein [Planctomycetota bacterium]|jgi:cytochrome b6-f complex iron-sulfur subunit